MAVKLANNAVSTLAASITDAATALSVQVADAGKFPVLDEGDWHPATIIDAAGNMEIVRVTARAANALTIARAQEGTTAKAFAAGSRIDVRVTAGVITKAALGLGNADNTSDATKPISAPQKAALDARVTWIAAGQNLPAENIGPIWHETYNSLMTWQSFTANGAAHTGYASVDVGKPAHEAVLRPGFLKLNGASIQKVSYWALWNWARHNGLVVTAGWSAGSFVFLDNADGTFRVPDLRGEFFRSADDGRGVDSGRTVGSWQAHMTASHSHGVNDPGHNHSVHDPGHVHGGVQNGQSSTGRSTSVDQPPAVYSFGNTWGATTGIWLSGSGTGISIQAAGGVETRPRNTAFLACIKF
ncbi:hypothetical protein J2766_001202 [Agrobacterium tumefaciens]|uniref:Phage tail protein n=1 Tax=Agrobacterium tumefaciens TaxID=358 RepID=A0AAW8LN63_AGRTU|nr:tail fiber protein [Agrobacterium tumefaciens]MBP2564643.1 hypothetical protein [Agrobacterium tumefaciens]MDR6701492.1 hypothetical protein [Agrobacterium tumefaciens]